MFKNLGKIGKWVFGITLLLFLVFGVASCTSGIGVGDIVVSRTPAELQQPVYIDAVDDETGEVVRIKLTDGLPEKISHNDNQREFGIWTEQQLRIAERWKANLAESGKLVGFIDAFVDLGIQIGEEEFEGLGLIGIAGAGLLGMFGFKRPGDKTKDEAEADKVKEREELQARWAEALRVGKEESYNEGHKVAEDTYVAILAALKEKGIDVEGLPAPKTNQ